VNLRLFFISCFTLGFVSNLSNITRPAQTYLDSVDCQNENLFGSFMPRSARVQYEGARYHIINRGNYRKDLFRTHKTDEAFTEVMLEACGRYQWFLHAYVLMSYHYHLCLETPQANLSDGMHWLQSTFANKFSRLSGERGHVFQGHYKSLVIEGDFGLLNVVDYIHLNPVRAGIVPVSQLKEYSNSSFPKYFSKYRHPNLRCEDFLAEAGGLTRPPGGMRFYHKRLKLIMEDSLEERDRLYLIVSKNLDVMKNKAQFASKGGSVVFYVTKRVAGWNAVLRAC
jgi:putative transposase